MLARYEAFAGGHGAAGGHSRRAAPATTSRARQPSHDGGWRQRPHGLEGLQVLGQARRSPRRPLEAAGRDEGLGGVVTGGKVGLGPERRIWAASSKGTGANAAIMSSTLRTVLLARMLPARWR